MSNQSELQFLLHELASSLASTKTDILAGKFTYVIYANLPRNSIVRLLEELGNVEKAKEYDVNVTSLGRLRGHFYSDTIFNFSHRVLSDAEIKVVVKRLDFALIQRKINETESREDFEEFCRRMRVKWNFRDEPTESISKKPAFLSKSSWECHPNLEVFLSQIENELFKTVGTPLNYSNLSKEEWEAVRSLADDRNLVIKKGFACCYMGQKRLYYRGRKSA